MMPKNMYAGYDCVLLRYCITPRIVLVYLWHNGVLWYSIAPSSKQYNVVHLKLHILQQHSST